MFLTLIRIFFGVDMALGLFNYAVWSWLFGQPFNIWFLLLSLLSTHLPDADMIPYLMLRRRYGIISHWIFGHHPLLVLPLTAGISYLVLKIWMSGAAGYGAVLMTCGVFLHFAHDGFHKLGFSWLSPFSFKYYRFSGGKFSAVPQDELDEWWEKVMAWRQQEKPSAADEISVRAPAITVGQFLIWGVGLVAVIIFAVVRR